MLAKKYRSIVENINEIIAVAQGDRFEFVNNKLSEITGYSIAEIMSMPFLEIVHPEDRQLVLQHYQDRFKTRKRTEYDFRILTKDGVTIWLQSNAVVIDWNGKPAALNLLTNITDRKQLEHALVNAKDEWENTFDAVRDWISIIDENRKIIRSNIASKSFTQLSPKEIIGRYCNEVVGEKNCSSPDCLLDRVIKSGQRETKEIQLEDGRWVLISIDPHKNKDGQNRFTRIVRDITGTKDREQRSLLTKKDQAFSVLFGGIAHDYNNLLSVIWGNIQLIRAEMADEEQMDSFTYAEQACEEARLLTHKYILLSRGFMLNKTLCSMKSILLSTTSNFLGTKGLHISLDIPDTIPDVELDIEYFKIALNNIISNGLEAMPGGGEIEIMVRKRPFAGEEAGDERYIEVVIKDYGKGIPKSELANIFDPYFSTKEAGSIKGSGLGLAVTQSIIKNHGGTIQLDSTPGEGTTVTLTIPVPIVESHVASLMKDINPSKEPVILLMEDDPPLRELCIKMLQRMKFQIIATSCEKECLNAFRFAREKNIEIALVLLDQNIKGNHGGSETLSELLQMGYEKKAVVVTGSPHSPVMLDYKKYGFDGRLLKPFTLKELETVVRQFGHY